MCNKTEPDRGNPFDEDDYYFSILAELKFRCFLQFIILLFDKLYLAISI